MQVIKPVTYAESQLISTTATETLATWLVGTTYALGDKRQYGVRLYESLVASNLGFQPDTNPTKWLDYAPDNKHAMFDNQVNTQTTRATPLTVVTKPGIAFNSIAYLNISGSSLNVKIQDGIGGTEVYNKTVPLDDTIILDWYMYFFEPFNLKTEVVLTNVPSYINGVITTTLTGTTTVLIGSLVYGTNYNLGATQYGASIGIKDYSVKNTDAFGNTTFVQRAFSKRLDASVIMNTTALSFNYKLLASIRAIPAVWIGSDASSLQPLVIFGYYRDFSIAIQYPTYVLCNLSIEGLI